LSRGCATDVRDQLSDSELSSRVLQTERMLLEPLCVAVGGSVSYGKSTLVNALLGRRVAWVQPEETRQVITHFRRLEFGQERVELEYEGGRREWRELEDGALPAIDQEQPGAVRLCTVFLESEILQTMSLLDTPGLFSPQPGFSEQGMAALQGRNSRTQIAMATAQALIYLIEEVVRGRSGRGDPARPGRGNGADRGRPRCPGPLGQGRGGRCAGRVGQAPAKHAARPPGGARARTGHRPGRPGPNPLPRCCLIAGAITLGDGYSRRLYERGWVARSPAFDQRRLGALLSSNDYGSSVERAATLHPLWQVQLSRPGWVRGDAR
jgi:hypothetical protein